MVKQTRVGKRAGRRSPFFVGVDLGGTNVRAGVVLRDGTLISSVTLRTEVASGTNKVLANIGEVIDRATEAGCRRGGQPLAVGVAVPGPLDAASGIVYDAPNFPQWKRFPLGAELARACPVPVFLDNDGNCAALGEHWVGAAVGCKHVAVLTLGTGVGGGLILEGRLVHGAEGFAGEVGHLVVSMDGDPCNCGGRGCLEAYSSATGLARMLNAVLSPRKIRGLMDRDGRLDVRAVAARARQGDEKCKMVFAVAGTALGAAFASFVNLFNLEMVVVGGGMAGAWNLIVSKARAEMYSRAFPRPAKRVRIVRAGLGTRAGMIGAARLAMVGLAGG